MKTDKKESKSVKIIPLGGLDKIGMNITAFEYGDSIVVSANGTDEEEAMKEIEKYLSGN